MIEAPAYDQTARRSHAGRAPAVSRHTRLLSIEPSCRKSLHFGQRQVMCTLSYDDRRRLRLDRCKPLHGIVKTNSLMTAWQLALPAWHWIRRAMDAWRCCVVELDGIAKRRIGADSGQKPLGESAIDRLVEQNPVMVCQLVLDAG